jgi:hypothetical protein
MENIPENIHIQVVGATAAGACTGVILFAVFLAICDQLNGAS